MMGGSAIVRVFFCMSLSHAAFTERTLTIHSILLVVDFVVWFDDWDVHVQQVVARGGSGGGASHL